MNLHEYQAKIELAKKGLPVPQGKVASTLEELLQVAIDLLSDLGRKFQEGLMIKAQVHTGGRGKAGGVRYVTSRENFTEVAKSLLGKQLVTYQTDEKGLPVNQLLVTVPCDIAQELYISALIDRSTKHVVFIASAEGGVEIETVQKETPEKIFQLEVNPLVGLMPYQAVDLGLKLNLPAPLMKDFTKILMGLYQIFIEKDLSLIEINPLIIDKSDQLICLDAKLTVDDNALFRQPEIAEYRDPSQEDPRESHALDWGLNYIALDGTIGCMVNGAGLAMGTMDLVKLHGGNPANFLDVGGGATKERVIEALKIILTDENVKGILINIFGGIVRCDMIAEGIIGAMSEVDVKVPIMVRLEGTNADKGIQLLQESGLNLMASDDLTTATKQIIEAAA